MTGFKQASHWTLVEERNCYNLVYSHKLNSFAEEYHLRAPTSSQRQQWINRMQSKDQEIIDVIDYQITDFLKPDRTFSHSTLNVYLEVIALRLSEASQSQFDCEEQWLLQCLKGFHKLFMRYGSFRIKASMVGITPNHKTRVWINPNFLCNQTLDGMETESGMVTSVINLFKKVNILIPEQHTSFKRMIEFMENKTLTRVRSKSDIIYIEKLQFKGETKECLDAFCSETKSSFEEINRANLVRSTMKAVPKVKLCQKRSTLKHIQIPSFSRFMASQNDIINKLMDPSISFQKKIVLIDEILHENSDTQLRKLCQVYKYSILHNDQELLKQLQRTQGKLCLIRNTSVLEKIERITGSQKQDMNDRCQVPPSRISQILNKQRAKRSKQLATDPPQPRNESMSQLRFQVGKLLLD